MKGQVARWSGITTLTLLIVSGLVSPTVFAQPIKQANVVNGCLQPPTYGNLVTLSDTQLAFYGLPKRPTTPSRLDWWRNVLQHARFRSCISVPSKRRRERISPFYAVQENTADWAGAVALNGGYQQVDSSWTFPCLGSNSRYNADVSPWIGLGGDTNDGGGYLLQVGSDAGVDLGGSQYSTLWWEDYPAAPQDIAPQGVRQPTCGDSITAEVDNGSTSSSQPYFMIEDQATGEYFGQYKSVPRSNGSTAEWVIEYNQSYLADFGGQRFSNDEVIRNGSVYQIGQLPTNSIDMWRNCVPGQCSNPVQQAYPGPIHDGTWFVDWWTNY